MMIKEPYYFTQDNDFTLYQGDSFEVLHNIKGSFDMIFADPPYFLSTGNGKVNVNGQYIKFDKGQWDRVRSRDEKDAFNRNWLAPCTKLLKQNGTIWICGTYHNIFSVEKCLDELGFKIINMVVWQKPDPPVTLSDRRFNFCAEYLIWATRSTCNDYVFNIEALKKLNGGVSMQDVWTLSAASSWEKQQGKHPTQKPLRLLYRAILASTNVGDRILDPFAGSSTTGVAANLMSRCFVGIDENKDYLDLSIRRREYIENADRFFEMKRRMEEDPEQVMVLVNHARPELKAKMIESGICYVRAGDSKGSVLVTYGFERMQYVLLHTNGEDCHLFRLKSKGTFKIWSKETLEGFGFHPEHSSYYVVLLFDNSKEMDFPKTPNLKRKVNTFRSRIRPLSDFYDEDC